MNYLFILLISILYTILFYGKVKGLSMLLFILSVYEILFKETRLNKK